MKYHAIALSVAALSVFAACSGSGGTGSGMGTVNTPVTPVMPSSMPSSPAKPVASAAPALTMGNFTTPTSNRGTQSGFMAANGFAVYDFDLDLNPPAGIPLGTSACNGPAPGQTLGCTQFWPPVPAPAGMALTAPFGVSKRLDGTLQLTYNGHPLYTYSQDTTAGVATGDGLNASGGVWHLAQTTAGSPLLTQLGTPVQTATPNPGATVY
jgi:predicted lipoprotein with Yx(FWY)xxD motif